MFNNVAPNACMQTTLGLSASAELLVFSAVSTSSVLTVTMNVQSVYQ